MQQEILENLKNAVLKMKPADAAYYANSAVENGIDPLVAIDVLIKAIKIIGDGFAKGTLYLPELVGGSQAMMEAMPILENAIKDKGGRKSSQSSVVIGTVAGDIHSIGISMIATLLMAGGFKVYNIGVDVHVDQFISAIKKYDPDILAMSSLMTTTASELRKVILALKEAGIRDKVKIMVGGGAITDDFANQIGADGYDPTAPGAVTLAKKMIA
jgi:5-methyltetrahydrofolate--homocysteine methyltransferase